MAELEVLNKRFYYSDSGDGSPVLFLHGSMSTGSAWRGIANELNGREYRLVAVDLWGYGRSDDWDEGWPIDLSSEAVLVEGLISHLDQPVHLVGHSHGGTLALEVARRGRANLKSLCLFEATPFNILKTIGELVLFEELKTAFTGYFDAVSKQEPHAVRRVIDYWAGRGAYDAMPDNVRAFLDGAVPMNMINVKAGLASTADPQDLARVTIPALAVYGEETAASSKVMSLAICDLLPKAEGQTVSRAGHFLISTHAQKSAEIIDRWIESVG
ncbi:alpha/beta fold hydrolase [Hoeflea sp.]|uniref:alpha/beta fold hydrolase n=1 Tax=Hoeflea sp. TaxID=1940281 RepID=UPI003B010C12